MYRRNIEPYLREALADTPVVLLHGARQTGKTTLAQKLANEVTGRYVSLDDATTLAAAVSDPSSFVEGLRPMTVIDEVQLAPQLFPAIKIQVDDDRRPGRYLLTGSANVLLLPNLSESLAGRMEIVTLWPCSQGELSDRQEGFIDNLFSSAFSQGRLAQDQDDIANRILAGGYPEAVGRKASARRKAWFQAYITTILQRDVRDLANIQGLTELPRLFTLLAARSGGLLNMSELSRTSGVAHTTLRRYLSLLEATFLLQLLPAWSSNLSKRLVKSPKIHLNDSGLASHLCGLNNPSELVASTAFGHLLETFVVNELQKQLGWNDTLASLFHFRSSNGREVDIVLEDRRGKIVGVEVKASASIGKRDFAGLEVLAEAVGKRFVRGVVLYLGNSIVPFGKKLNTLPVSALWLASD